MHCVRQSTAVNLLCSFVLFQVACAALGCVVHCVDAPLPAQTGNCMNATICSRNWKRCKQNISDEAATISTRIAQRNCRSHHWQCGAVSAIAPGCWCGGLEFERTLSGSLSGPHAGMRGMAAATPAGPLAGTPGQNLPVELRPGGLAILIEEARMWPLKEARMSPGVPTRSFRWRLLSLAGSRARAEGPWCQPRAAVAAGPQNARLKMAPLETSS